MRFAAVLALSLAAITNVYGQGTASFGNLDYTITEATGYVAVSVRIEMNHTDSSSIVRSPSTVSFSDSDYTVRESRGFVPVTVEIKESLTVPFTVTVETQDETAVNQVDYEGGQFNITFQIGQIRVPFNITIINDEEPPLEPDETFRINFLPPVNQPEFATVTIKDKCTRQCQNGGTLDSSVCNCTCPPLYTGLSCETQVNLTQGVHTLYHVDTEATLGVVMYEFATDVLYGHPGGLNINSVTLPSIVGFKRPYQQVREEEGAILICLLRRRNLDRNDTVMVFTPQQWMGEELATGDLDYANVSVNVTFHVGVSEACFEVDIYMDEELECTERFRLKIMDTGEGIEVDKDSAVIVVEIVDTNSSCHPNFLFMETAINSQAKVPCSQLDGSFLPNGIVTSMCTNGSTWGPLDMSQCTFRNDASVAAVAVIEVMPLVEDSFWNMEGSGTGITEETKQAISSSYVENTTLLNEYLTCYGARVQVYSLRLNSTVAAEELQGDLKFDPPAMATRVIITRRADFCSCCDGAAIELSVRLIKTTNSCAGNFEAPMACNTCLKQVSHCQQRFSSLDGLCFLDTDRDGKPDYNDPCVGCCLPDFDLAFQWKRTAHNRLAEALCSKIHPSFTDTKVRRRCQPDDSWEPADISSCTFKNNTKNPIVILTASLVVSREQDRAKVILDIQRTFEKQLPNITKGALPNSTAAVYNITAQETTSTYSNGTTVSIIVFVVEFESSVELREDVSNVKEEATSSGVSYEFVRLVAMKPSESCSCETSNGQLVSLCIGTSSSPCDCSDIGSCKCIDPYVNDADTGKCSLDIDGDGRPDYRDECPGVYGAESNGCPLPVPSTLAVFCPAEEDSVWRIQWPEAAPGSTQSVRCPGEGDTPGLGLAHRSCLAGGVWGSVDVRDCESLAVRDIRIQTRDLNLYLNFTRQNGLPLLQQERRAVVNLSLNLRQTLNQSVSMQGNLRLSIYPQDLKTSTNLLTLIGELGDDNNLFSNLTMTDTEQQKEVVVDIVDSLLNERNKPAFATTSEGTNVDEDAAGPPAVQILESTEKVTNAITSSLLNDNSNVTIYRPNIAVQEQSLSFNQLHVQGGIQFPGEGVMLLNFNEPSLVPNINLPSDFIFAARGMEHLVGANRTEDNSERVGVVNTVWNNIENYLPNTVIEEGMDKESLNEGNLMKPQPLPASLVVSSQILGYGSGEVNSNATVEITFPVKKEIRNITVPPGRVKQLCCAFFNFTGGANGTGGWSYRGVRTEVINDTYVRCTSSHLTSFMVLVSVVPHADLPLSPLDYITYIGCSISFLCLLACIFFFISLRNELMQKLHNFVHLNLCIALSLGLLLFLTGIQTATGNASACKFVTALLHYFFLATFTWTLCEAVLIYILLVRVFGANDRKWIYLYLSLGWALPIPIVVISAAAGHDYYLIRHSFNESSSHFNQIKACWLPSHNGMIFAFVGPMIAILLVNAVLLTISLGSLAKSQTTRVREKSKDEKKKEYMEVGKRLFKATLILVPLMGFTWIIGLFAVGEEGRVFAYLFVIANVFQGLFIFLLHVLRHEKVYGKIKSKLPNPKRLLTDLGPRAAPGTFKSKESDSTKFTSSAATTEAVADNLKGVVGTVEGGNKDALELMDRPADDEQKTKDYDTPMTATTTTKFGKGSTGTADEGSVCSQQEA